jgi:hypothetical protein
MPLTMTFSFFLPPAQPIAGKVTMTAASTSQEERVTVLDATFAEEQLRSGSFTGLSPSCLFSSRGSCGQWH